MNVKKNPRIYPEISSFKDLVKICEGRGDKVAFKYPVGKSFETLSYGDFAKEITAIAAGLTALGLAGKRIAVIGDTSHMWVASYFATVASGGVIIPMDKELAIGEIGGFLAGVEAEAIFYAPSFNEKIANAIGKHPSLRRFIPFAPSEDSENGDTVISLASVIERGKKELEAGYTIPDRDSKNLAVMLFTSGTTGTSKCVMLCEHNIIATANAACASVNFSGEDRTLSVLPLHHTYEMTIMVASLIYGIEVGINDSLRNLMRNINEVKPTALILVPLFVNTIYKRIWDSAKKRGKDKLLRRMIPVSNTMKKVGLDLRRKLFASVLSAFGGELCKIICGGAPLNPEMVKNFYSFGIQICEGYGITECSPLISVSPYFAQRRGSVGPAVPCCEARIADGAMGESGFVEGEIQVKGENVMLGYYNNDEANATAFTEDGWYRTGDVGYMDADGYIYITGRLKSVIVLENGKNVFPEEIEEYLEAIEEIAECVVVGRKGADGETVNLTAVVYPNRDLFPEGATNEQIYKVIDEKIAAINKKIASFKKIKALELRDEEFEKTTSRKIKRHLVK
ncbi:MAG: AMP-binding protein [Clostridia bacterium]|nr:AMP-binding protein [Clostridia bacterium]